MTAARECGRRGAGLRPRGQYTRWEAGRLNEWGSR